VYVVNKHEYVTISTGAACRGLDSGIEGAESIRGIETPKAFSEWKMGGVPSGLPFPADCGRI